jgi:hypothetical protein
MEYAGNGGTQRGRVKPDSVVVALLRGWTNA